MQVGIGGGEYAPSSRPTERRFDPLAQAAGAARRGSHRWLDRLRRGGTLPAEGLRRFAAQARDLARRAVSS